MRVLALGQPLNDSPEEFKRWVQEALREIERASNEHGGEGDEAVSNSAGTAVPLVDSGSGAVGTSARWAHEDHVHPVDTDTAAEGAAAAIAAALGTADPLMDGTASPGASTTKLSREDHVHPSDTSRLATAGGQNVTGGFTLTPYDAGNMGSGTFTFNPVNGNYQYAGNNGAVQIQVPASDCAMDILITNGASAGAITFAAGFTVNSNIGEPFTTTNGHKFILSIRRINGVSTYVNKALQ